MQNYVNNHLQNHLNRRLILQSAAAGLTVLAAGCATSAKDGRPRVVVIGGGWGGMGAARALAESNKVAVTLLEPNESFISCPMSALFYAGHEQLSYLQRSYAPLDKLGIRRVRERAIGIDRAAQMVVTATQKLPYDFLVLSPGIEYMEESLPGYAQGRDQLPVGFRAFEQLAVKQQIDTFLSQGGNMVITAPKPPYRCPPAPYERAMMVAEQMKLRGTKGKIILIDANPNPMPPPIAKPVLHAMQSLYADQIEYMPNTEMRSVDAARKVLSTSKGDISYRAANIVLPMRAPSLIREAKLGERWASIKLPTFQSSADDKIYVIGDSVGTPLPMSGHVAFSTGQQVANDILATILGKAVRQPLGTEVTLPAGICWCKVTKSNAIMIYVTPSMEIGQPPKNKFQVDPQHNPASGKASRDWAQSMWNAMLG
ncbi:MAG: NAD(P)/FAD-dependent oxidoreductase [Polaromonas sp.]|jgi:sulfide dehydrogenase [flavocytochrome c] flavoprotein subunit|nr:NAD(P)/FAD-dependent oxidoreductase [Polaromonas sp.]MBK9339638.1 NAD(P)/FAD-dependent oxidoreductase [Rhodoferax sp.]NMD13647.1 NAD(P)/FAD-dependent oxidoreductase [Candidatus Cloacimonadota bacterium]MBK7027215.1 NAD(P)/FAD-dependent oxidoreductase [Polaromonas sp.]MBK7501355.1 NAD(P)/FAD-dependent oxidoreductase [Polaromonas sp.]